LDNNRKYEYWSKKFFSRSWNSNSGFSFGGNAPPVTAATEEFNAGPFIAAGTVTQS
jgi:hypothetical protein